MNENIESKKKFTTVTDLMETYSLSRATILRWIKSEDAHIRYFQDEKFLRVHLQDFEDYINRRIEESMNKDFEK